MNEVMIERWNERVLPEDEVYHLGDFGFGEQEPLQKIFDRLNGRKHFVWGNHDKTGRKLNGWVWVRPYHELHVENQLIVLMHYAMRVWNQSHRGSTSLFGHSHGRMPGNSQSLDVGVDCWDFRPVALDEINARLATLPKFTGYAQQAGGSDHDGNLRPEEVKNL